MEWLSRRNIKEFTAQRVDRSTRDDNGPRARVDVLLTNDEDDATSDTVRDLFPATGGNKMPPKPRKFPDHHWNRKPSGSNSGKYKHTPLVTQETKVGRWSGSKPSKFSFSTSSRRTPRPYRSHETQGGTCTLQQEGPIAKNSLPCQSHGALKTRRF